MRLKGESYDNQALAELVAYRMGSPISDADRMNLSELGFVSRHHIQDLTDEENRELELEVGT